MDVSFLAPVFSAAGPYATVCADVTHTTENADTELDLRVRAIAERLTGQGAPEAVVEAVDGTAAEARVEDNQCPPVPGQAICNLMGAKQSRHRFSVAGQESDAGPRA